MGRDDRSISENGKEVRFPFLDRNLIEQVFLLPPHILTNFNLPKGTGGDKVLLRNIALKLGLK